MKKIPYTSLIFKEGAVYVGFCPELNVSSCGDTVDETRSRLREAVRLFIEESSRMGTLEDILAEEGYVAKDSARQEWMAPPLIATEHCELTL